MPSWRNAGNRPPGFDASQYCGQKTCVAEVFVRMVFAAKPASLVRPSPITYAPPWK
jgi:hypothetical protein